MAGGSAAPGQHLQYGLRYDVDGVPASAGVLVVGGIAGIMPLHQPCAHQFGNRTTYVGSPDGVSLFLHRNFNQPCIGQCIACELVGK